MPETKNENNRLLAELPSQVYDRLLPKLENVPLTFKEQIYKPGDIISHVYFPQSGVISLLTTVEENSSLEVGIVGNEGMIGLPVFLGITTSGNCALVQGEGVAYRLRTEDFLDACGNSDLSRVLHRFTHSLMIQISQSAACNRFHQIEARLARWLLMMHDRLHTDDYQITQEFLSNMLGVRREAVNIAARNLHKRDLINYTRGNLTVLDRAGLESASCPCYEIIKRDYDRFLI